ncbi:divergent PAP2 family protein [bacterium]|nr:divergent PAP2 family protein [bacterium]
MEYKFIIIPLAVVIINQIIKLVLEMFKGNFSWPKLLGYGGMPSSHSALVTSLLIVLGYYQGLKSPEFAIAAIVAMITIKDAAGIRWQLGSHGRILNQLVKELPNKKEYKYPILNERFGHTSLEVLVGVLLGIVLTVLAILIWK